MSLTCEQALAQAETVNLDSCNLLLVQSGGHVVTNATYFEQDLCPSDNNNGTRILPNMDWETMQIALAFQSVAGTCSEDTVQVTALPLTCNDNGDVVVQLDIDEARVNCVDSCRGIDSYHYAVQLPLEATVKVNASYTRNCGSGTNARFVERNDWLLGMALMATMLWKNLVR